MRNVSPAMLQILRTPFIVAFLAMASTSPQTAVSQGPAGRFTINAVAIAAAVSDAGLNISPEQVRLPLQLTAGSQNPALRVSGAELLADNRLHVRLSCNEPGSCLPFFVVLSFHDKTAALTAFSALNSSFSSELPIRHASGPALHAGDRTVLLMEDEHMRISLPVVSIDSGRIGSEIRVSSLDRKKTYQGTVLSAQVVKGRLP